MERPPSPWERCLSHLLRPVVLYPIRSLVFCSLSPSVAHATFGLECLLPRREVAWGTEPDISVTESRRPPVNNNGNRFFFLPFTYSRLDGRPLLVCEY